MEDRRCKLGLQGRLELIELISAGATFRAAAAALGVAPATAHRWWVRWQQASDAERASLGCLRTRSTRPKSCPWALNADAEQKILRARERTNWGPMRLAALTGRHRSTIWKVLHRHGQSRRRRGQRQTFKRFEWSQPGALLHIDAYSAPKFLEPGHRVTGDRDQNGRARGLGKTVVIAVQDDHSRLVYAELHSAENADNVSITLKRAAAWMRDQGCGPVEAVMSDNAYCYTKSPKFQAVLDELGARHIRIPPYTPRWNGKIERFFGTLEDEWAHGRVWPNSATRDRALSSFIRYFNRYRPHSAAGGRPPTTRVHQLRGQD
ncbi:MAG TPA: integrase core domain-containing protein, partial [Solirubrobacteraceae bacterium]|nr:integrase core domain-containing protein [Solirubrobacteraceae bacterium]